ncbi:hypothetical protein ES705_25388 [subsurface metagenome]
MEAAVVKAEETEVLEYNHAENVASIKKDFEKIRSLNAEYAVVIGNKFILAKENIPHGKWLETLEELDITPRQAQRLMKITATFGDNPEVIEGMSQRRAYFLTALPEENLIQLKHDGLVTLPDGTTFTLAEYHEMSGKEFENKIINLRNQKNKELSDWRSRALTSEAEMKEMRKESKEREDFLKNYMHDKDAATADKIEKLNALLADVDAEKNKLKLELMDKNQEQFTDQEVVDAIAGAKKAIDDVFMKINNVKLSYWKTKLIAKVQGFIAEAQEQIRWVSINIGKKIDEGLSDDSTNQDS